MRNASSLSTDALYPNPRATTGLVLGVVGAVAFSGKAIIIKLAYRHGVDPVTLLMLRMLFALPLFVAMAWWAGRGQAQLSGGDWLGVLGLGFSGYYLASYLDFAGLQYISAGLERLILYLSPTVVMALGWLLYRKRVTRRQLASMAISYAGLLLVFGVEAEQSGSNVALGALLVFLSVVSYAVYLVYSGEMVRRLGALRLVGLASTAACLFCIAQFLLLRPVADALAVAAPVLWLSLLNATLCTAVPVLLVMMAVERIGASMTAQVGMVGPVSTILLSVLILGEPFTGWIAAGTLLVFVGMVVLSRSSVPAR